MKKFSLLVAVAIFFTTAVSAKNNTCLKPVKGNVSKYEKFKNQKPLRRTAAVNPVSERKLMLKK